MPSLADLQGRVQAAVVHGDMAGLRPLVCGGGDTAARVRLHHRHYHASLVEALVARHPATAWLVGLDVLRAAAETYVRETPPRVLCIAEYGAGFPGVVGADRPEGPPPYVRWFAELEQHLGTVSLAVDDAVLDRAAIATVDPDDLFDMAVGLQPGVRYLDTPWPVDELMRLYVTDSAPDRLALAAQDVRLEIRGVRGEFSMRRLDLAPFTFRRALLAGHSLGQAAEAALATGAPFDIGTGLTSLFDEGLIVATISRQSPEMS